MGITEWTIIGTGVVLAGLILTSTGRLSARLSARIDRLDDRVQHLDDQVRHLGERTAKVEGLLEGLRESIIGRKAA